MLSIQIYYFWDYGQIKGKIRIYHLNYSSDAKTQRVYTHQLNVIVMQVFQGCRLS